MVSVPHGVSVQGGGFVRPGLDSQLKSGGWFLGPPSLKPTRKKPHVYVFGLFLWGRGIRYSELLLRLASEWGIGIRLGTQANYKLPSYPLHIN